MKHFFKTMLFVLAIGSMISCSSSDETDNERWDEDNEYASVRVSHEGTTVRLKQPGQLHQVISLKNKKHYDRLIVRGQLNGTDILTLRELSGTNVTGDSVKCFIDTLDLSKSMIVSGGDIYYTNNSSAFGRTSDNVIGPNMFYRCGFTKLVLPYGVVRIEENGLMNCYNLKEVEMSDNVTTFGISAFANCTKLEKLNLSKALSTIGAYCFTNTQSLKSLTLPESMSIIPEYAFTLSGLEVFDCGNGVTDIRVGAFSNCKELRSFTFGNKLAFINSRAFYNCTALRDIYANAMTPPEISENSFEGVQKETVTVHVNSYTIADAYNNNMLWGRFGTITYQ